MPRADAIAAAETLIWLVQIYAGAGAVVAAAFLLVGIGRVMPAGRDSFLFRLIILPGAIGLWPLVLWRWLRLERDGPP